MTMIPVIRGRMSISSCGLAAKGFMGHHNRIVLHRSIHSMSAASSQAPLFIWDSRHPHAFKGNDPYPSKPQMTTTTYNMNMRNFTNTPINQNWKENEDDDDDDDDDDDEKDDGLVYKGPFAKLTLKLKRVSLTTAFFGLVGVPLLAALKNGGDVPAVGKAAVGGVAVLAATGSTLALSFCFSPYIHTLEKLTDSHNSEDNSEQKKATSLMLKATTRNILGLTVETTFDPSQDVQPYNGNRPFCNFIANDKKLYVHPELIHDPQLYKQLFGESKEEKEDKFQKEQQKNEDEGLF